MFDIHVQKPTKTMNIENINEITAITEAAETTTTAKTTTTTEKNIKDAIDTKLEKNKDNTKYLNISNNKMNTDVVVDLTTATTSEIISLSDGEEEILKTPTIATVNSKTNINKKRRSVSDNKLADEEHYNQLKRRKIKVAGAPKMPLTGYVRYMNERRETLRKEHPNKTAMEHTKIICEEWHQLSEEKKGPFMKAYALDKQRYEDELNSFLKANPNVLANELAKNKQMKQKANEAKTAAVFKEKCVSDLNMKNPNIKDKDASPNEKQSDATILQTAANSNNNNNNNDSKKPKRTPTPTNGHVISAQNSITTSLTSTVTPGEIPIFTTEFLEHNKVCDMELRTLRKSKQDLEQQNAVLEKHVENMKVGVYKMTTENNELQKKNKLLEIYVLKLKKKLADALSGLALPNEPNGATTDNIEKYLSELHKMATTNTHGPACLNKAKDILRKLDMQINF